MCDGKKVKQIQVQLGYGESEPKNISNSNQVHKCIQVQLGYYCFKLKQKYKFKVKYKLNYQLLSSVKSNIN